MNLLVTGGGRGIGAAVARLAASRGSAVAITYASDAASAQHIVAEIERAGGRAVAMQADAADTAAVEGVFARAEAAHGPLDALVNNAGITGDVARLEDASTAMIARVMAVNVVGPFAYAREAIRRMSTQRGGRGGAIVNVSSIASRIGGGGEWVHYAASKGAIDTFTLGLAREVARDGIRVNAVSPGLIETDIHAAAGDGKRLERLSPSVPIGRAGRADEVAEAILWLLSPEASYITASILEVGGGR